MITSKEDYEFYLEADRIALSIKRKQRASLLPDIYKFQILLRKIEYYKNCKRSLVWKPYFLLLSVEFHLMSILFGFTIPPNVFGPGLAICHVGTIIVNHTARVGANCRLHAMVSIGTMAGAIDKAPTIGNNVYIGPGVKLFGPIYIADGIAIGANSVVNKSFLEPNITIAGIPAKKISDKGSEGLLTKATDLISDTKFEKIKKKKIIFFSDATSIGGAEVYLQILASNLNRRRFDVRVAIPRNTGTEEFVDELRSKNITVDFIKKCNILNNFFYFRRNKPEYIHFNVPVPDIRCCAVGILAGIIYSRSKLYATEHLVPIGYIPHPFIRLTIRLLYSRLDMSITVSDNNKKALINNFKLAKNKIKVIYNCTDIDYISNYNQDMVSELKNRFSINDPAVVFGTVGRLSVQKGHEYLIEASKSVIREVPTSLFLFVGKGKLKDQLIQKIDQNNVGEYYRLAGYQENLPEILALIDIFVLPSISEGFPFAVLEAMAARKPVIATRVGGVPEIITDSINGILVEPMDSDALAKAMVLLAKDSRKRNYIAEMGYENIKKNYSLEKMILATEEIYSY